MIVRRAQIAALNRQVEGQFRARMIEHLRSNFPGTLGRADQAALSKFVDEQTARAGQYGITDESDVEFYLECAAILGSWFDKDERIAWAGETLRRLDFSGTAKMNRINDYLIVRAQSA
jgi:hypothetical protein